jgi:hypothetical protein
LKNATVDQAQAFTAHMMARFGGMIVPQSAVSSALKMLIGIDLTPLLHAKAVTLGPLVYVADSLSPDEQMEVIVHECEHLVDWHKDPIEFYWLYLISPEQRVQAEARAFRAQLEFAYARSRQLPSLDALAMPLEGGYLLGPNEIALGRQLLESAATSVADDVVSTEAGRAAIDWLWTHAPELLAT